MILALPLVAILALGGLIAAGAYGTAADADQARRLVALGGTAGDLVAQLQRERAAAALVFARNSAAPAVDEYTRQGTATDTMVARFRDARRDVQPLASLRTPLRRVDAQLAGLGRLRDQVRTSPYAASSAVIFQYRATVADLITYRQGLSQLGVEGGTANNLRASAALSQAIESLGLIQAAVVHSVGEGPLTPAAQQEIVGADTGFADAMQTFQGLAPASWQSLINDRVTGPSVLQAERLQGVATRAAPGTPLELDTTATGWSSAIGARMDLLHGVEHELDAGLLDDVTEQRDAQVRMIVVLGATILTALIVMLLIGWWVTRSMTGSLNRLRLGAEAVAVDRLPRMVAQVDVGHDQAAIQRLMAEAAAPIPIDGKDEIGQVSAAFNSVAAAAVRITGEQAALRATVSGILLSLSRRLQLRADRMMVSLDGLERYEEDPDRLAKLFDLDHVATLIRRLISNLQVLSGGRAGRPVDQPVALPDLLRAASAEIDDYKRVEVGSVDDGLQVSRDAAVDLMHLLAEVLDNATKFSPPSTMVVLEGRRVGDLLHIQIHDSGIGMRQETLEAVRERLAHPHRMDQGTTQQMGVPVIGRIAERHGIKIDIRSELHAGTRVDVTVPSVLLIVTPPRQLPQLVRAAPTAVPSSREPSRREPAPTSTREWAPFQPTAQFPQATTAPLRSAPALRPVPAPAPSVAPVIFDEMRSENRRSWFTPMGGRGTAQADTGPIVPSDWQVSSAAAGRSHAPTSTTENGLPVRQPGRRLVPALAASERPQLPFQRDPESLRQQMSAFETGLGAAGRRHTDAVDSTTENGLPVRDPGRQLVPALTATARPQPPFQRDPESLRRQMSAFETGLGAAGRRSNHVPEEPAP